MTTMKKETRGRKRLKKSELRVPVCASLSPIAFQILQKAHREQGTSRGKFLSQLIELWGQANLIE